MVKPTPDGGLLFEGQTVLAWPPQTLKAKRWSYNNINDRAAYELAQNFGRCAGTGNKTCC